MVKSQSLLPSVWSSGLKATCRKVAIGKESDSPWTAHYYRTAGRSAPIYALPLNSVFPGLDSEGRGMSAARLKDAKLGFLESSEDSFPGAWSLAP